MSQPPVDPPPPYGHQWPAPPPPPPPWQYPPWPPAGSPYEQPKSGTNGFTIAALVFGIIPICFLGIIFGIVGLVQASKSGEKGKGLAIAGIVLNVVWLIGGFTVALISSSDGSDVSQPSPSRHASFGLKVGQCVNGLVGELKAESIEPVACALAHEGEVFAVIDLPSGRYPGITQVRKRADTDCFRRLEEDHPQAYDDKRVSVDYVYPSQRSWDHGDRELTCLVEYDTRRAGSIDDAYLTGG
ncbi:DUF4190 domain-containing protein [Nocardioides marmorisolisilvae]|uniref:DUF4190 domain-containing protein n=1 Tax=Nocardioides marmorisolisilvae TaxID=1542737 RepID=A0A3N0DJP3_9ACTN|nr:DUF4190 domain-containing protein [Nocardioides marmorisolisilvae]RNL75463.1 DUF4190 domain-containing protein [Nocardioides marmorisolisilvae]